MADVQSDDNDEAAYVCSSGHVTPAGSWDRRHAAAIGEPLPFDYTKFCRRSVTLIHDPDFRSDDRCKLPVQLLRKFPVLYSAFLMGGELAVRALVIENGLEEHHGQEVENQGP